MAKERKVSLTFYKANGKFYTGGTAVVKHYIFEAGYKQDIVNTQNALLDGWQNSPFYVRVSDAPKFDIVYGDLPSEDTFDEHLFIIGAFHGLEKETGI